MKTDWKKGDSFIAVTILGVDFVTHEFTVGACDGEHVWALAPGGEVCGMPAYHVAEIVQTEREVTPFVRQFARTLVEQAIALEKRIVSKELKEELNLLTRWTKELRADTLGKVSGHSVADLDRIIASLEILEDRQHVGAGVKKA